MIIAEPRIVCIEDRKYYCEHWEPDNWRRRYRRLLAMSRKGEILAEFPFTDIEAFIKCNKPETWEGIIFLG